ncbi:hypothetical protein, partial [Mucilaginibacter sp. NFR10]|uniref:hypothetical protein n=1 Tax=Mucilaginibacter sp. NFR10 TaxID=1566292 RepID=UPI00087190AF
PTMLREPQHDTRFNVVNLSAKACQPELVEGSRAEALRRATHDKKKNVVFRSRSASGENEQNDAGRCGCRGIASFCRSGGIACESGQNNCSPWFCSFCGVKAVPMAMGPGCAQRSLSAASLFGYFCGKTNGGAFLSTLKNEQ